MTEDPFRWWHLALYLSGGFVVGGIWLALIGDQWLVVAGLIGGGLSELGRQVVRLAR